MGWNVGQKLYRDKKLIDYLEHQKLLLSQIADIKAFLDLENKRIASEIDLAEPAWLNADSETSAKLDNIINYFSYEFFHDLYRRFLQYHKPEMKCMFLYTMSSIYG